MTHEAEAPSQTPRVLALVPSAGLGGGIEAYFAALSEALSDLGAEIETVELQNPQAPLATPLAKARFALRSVSAARRMTRRGDVLLLVLHVGLLPVALLAQRVARLLPTRCALFFYGSEIWGHKGIGGRFAHRAGWRVVTISSFSAGGLIHSGPVTVLPPGIPRERYDCLIGGASSDHRSPRDIDILSVFRLDSAESKGASALLRAGDILRRRHPAFSLIIAGSGRATKDLHAAVAERRTWVELRENVRFDDLATLYRRAKVFVLATRSHLSTQRGFQGEGFGIVLAEAQLAGSPVVAPCLGGSSDAYVDGVTGLRPANETAEALAATIDRLLSDDDLLKSMAQNSRRWAMKTFCSDNYSRRVRELLLALAAPSSG
ncbi:MAG TPA: glycosyltransferase family 4 protein [Acidimicrobiales bacterium]|nr:glycosyltransferase family 4 protein [Acidimicrobiales bacterium]